MPDRRTHREVGAMIGAGAALFHARYERGREMWAEVVGGVVGGAWGGQLPDELEPAVTPRHRDVAHSLVALAGVAGLTLEAGRLYCRNKASECARRRLDSSLDPLSHFLLILVEAFWRFVAGAMSGLQAGYLSHLALDGATPMGLPLLFR